MLVSFIQRSSLSIQSHSKPLPVLRSVSSWWTTQTRLSWALRLPQVFVSPRNSKGNTGVTDGDSSRISNLPLPPNLILQEIKCSWAHPYDYWSSTNTCRSSFFADFYHIPNLENSMGPFSPNIVTPWSPRLAIILHPSFMQTQIMTYTVLCHDIFILRFDWMKLFLSNKCLQDPDNFDTA